MVDSLDVIIVDDDPVVCNVIAMMIKLFYSWGQVYTFTKAEEAVSFCRKRKSSLAIFVLDVFLEEETGFGFLEAIVDRYPLAYQDTIIVTGNVSEDVINMCVASNITYLIEKPIRPYTLQMAVRAIVAKYIKFAKKILQDPVLAKSIDAF
ncbi:MAG: histidine kinase [Deltaproteobacteria bacterium RBG_13_43_22]|jgi:response regulator of citrate/malate metabolism|nr:MAG: histidine kinase [Deltaproteobacteria bacterium RBG_13_43_22]